MAPVRTLLLQFLSLVAPEASSYLAYFQTVLNLHEDTVGYTHPALDTRHWNLSSFTASMFYTPHLIVPAKCTFTHEVLYVLCTSGDITEDVELIEGLEETKRIATDIGQRSALAKETQVYGLTSGCS